MKKLILPVAMSLFSLSIYSQSWDKGGNNVSPSPFILGSNSNNAIMFETANTIRMKINNGGFGPANGRIAMGHNLPPGFTPTARLQLHQSTGFNHIQFTSNTTIGGASPITASGFHVGINNANEATLRQRENEAMRFYTRNAERMYINPNRVSTINGFTGNITTGYVGIGPNTVNAAYPNGVWNNVGPFSLLHLNGAVNNNMQLGYLPWMQTGITLTDNSDLSYFGLRTVGGAGNNTETVILWSNDDLLNTFEDDMVFRFARTVNPPNTTINTVDLDAADDLDGRHIARFTGTGNFGLGATFGRVNLAYVVPASLMHMSRTDTSDVWFQITNRLGTQETASDGLRIGITNSNGIAHIRQQEDAPLIFYTNSRENARMEPGSPTTGSPNPGMMGIGDWTTPFNILPVNVIDAKLDIDGDLRIRQLTQDDNLSMVLVADQNDHNRVHWRDINSFGLGNICGTGTNPLISNWEIPLNDNAFVFVGQAANDRVVIGTSCGPLAKFHVLNNTGNTGFINSLIQTTHSNGFSAAFAVVNTSTVVGSIAGVFVASSANKTHAIVVPNTGGNVGFGTISPNTTYRLEVNGGTNFNGPIFQNNILISSDQIFKTNVDSISDALNIINQLIPRTYFLDTNNVYGMNFSGEKQYGFVAQEVEPFLPELISNLTKDPVYDSLGNMVSQGLNYKSLNYNAFISILTKGIKEQQVEINNLTNELSLQDSVNNDLESRLLALESCINEAQLCTGNARLDDSNNEGTVVELANINAIILDQNLPNPFKEKTTINYSIPEEVMEATLLFYDLSGRIIKQVDITERGEGKLTVYGENLKNGIYTYSLIADGKLIATKKMVKQ